jgi:uncharacterized membrane protein YdcZ (DUF606 family)
MKENLHLIAVILLFTWVTGVTSAIFFSESHAPKFGFTLLMMPIISAALLTAAEFYKQENKNQKK